MSGRMSPEEKASVEQHLSGCRSCRDLVWDTHSILRQEQKWETVRALAAKAKKNFWLFLSVCSLALSFLLPKYFLQFLTAGLLSGLKWVFDPRQSKIMIMVREAIKESEKETSRKSSRSRTTR
jgi:Fe-S oxidoreductase